MFKELSKKGAHERELEILKTWEEEDVFNKSMPQLMVCQDFITWLLNS